MLVSITCGPVLLYSTLLDSTRLDSTLLYPTLQSQLLRLPGWMKPDGSAPFAASKRRHAAVSRYLAGKIGPDGTSRPTISPFFPFPFSLFPHTLDPITPQAGQSIDFHFPNPSSWRQIQATQLLISAPLSLDPHLLPSSHHPIIPSIL